MHTQTDTASSDLTGIELEFQFYKALGLPVVGMPHGPFAIQLGDTLYVRKPGDGEKLPDCAETESKLLALKIVQDLNATFHCSPERVVCHLDKVTAAAITFTEAAMKAYILYCALHNSPQ